MQKCSILAPPWHPAVPKMTAKITQVAPKVASENSLGNYYLRNCSQGRFRIGPGHQCDRFRMDFALIFDGFWMDLDEIGHNFSRVVVAFLQQHLQSAKAALARNEQTENVKNMQIYAETCKKTTQTKTCK